MSKGKRRERQAAELFRTAGYATHSPQESKWGETDMFGLFDVVAVQERRSTCWIQVKSNGARGIHEWCEGCRELLGADCWMCLFAVAHDGEGWRLLRCNPDTLVDDAGEWTTLVDERDRECNMGEAVTEWLRE